MTTANTEKVTLPTPDVSELTFDAENLDIPNAVKAYHEYGCLLIRGLMKPHLEGVLADINATIATTIELIPQARKVTEGWSTPNGSLLLPAPEGFPRDKQIMTLPINYHNSAAFFMSALEPRTLDLMEGILGPDIELFGNGQSLVKEPVGGHPKHLHQDAAYFEHKYEGPAALLAYGCDVDENNGCLWTVPGSHKLGVLNHVDTFSHLGLDDDHWPWEGATPIHGKAGDAIIFHVNCIHGSKPNWSENNRPVFIHRYRRADDFVVISATTSGNRAEREKEANQAKKDNQKGFMVRGYRKFGVDEGRAV